MNREDVDKIGLGKSGMNDISMRRKPTNIPVVGLPPHLHAEIRGSEQSGYQYRLTRKGEELSQYAQSGKSNTPEHSLQALKGLLNWDPV